jgi:quinol monooxygenase YgiN/quercetin dioxygenase-like cupin family protein
LWATPIAEAVVRHRVRIVLSLLLAVPAGVAAQDPTTLYPGNYQVMILNDQVRVMDFQLKRGAREVMHMHPAHVLYVLTGFKIRFTFPDGSTKVRETKAGDVLYSEAVTHSPENIGDTDAHGILVELRQAPAPRPAGARGGGGTGAAPPLTAFTFVHGLPGQGEMLKQHLLSLTAPTRAEDGAIRYDLYQSVEHPDEFLRHEVWRDHQALEAHKLTPPLRASFERRQREGWSTAITLWRPAGE